MRLICYYLKGNVIDIKPASTKRDWMNFTPDHYAYHCLPLTIANSHGWTIHLPQSFSVKWDGGEAASSLKISSDEHNIWIASSHFGSGILTFQVNAMFRTEPQYNLWVGGVPNQPKDGIYPLTGIVETDWMPFTFTMNWKITRPHTQISFTKGEAYCFIFPIQRGYLAKVSPQKQYLEENSEDFKRLKMLKHMRDLLNFVKAKYTPNKFSNWYRRGEIPDESINIENHEQKLTLLPFIEPLY